MSQQFPLSTDPVLGDWTIFVAILGQEYKKSFTVAEYVLPTFDVEVGLPPYATYRKSNVVVRLKALYTYGKPVKGEVTLTVQPRVRYSTVHVRPLEQFQIKAEINGEVNIPVNVVKSLNLRTDHFDRDIEFFALVEEGLTGKKYNKTGVLKLFERDVKVDLVKTSKTFKPGLRYRIVLKVAFQDETPVDEGNTIKLNYGYSYNEENFTNVVELPVRKGLASVDVLTPRDGKIFVLGMIGLYNGEKYYMESIEAAQSPSNNFIQVAITEEDVIRVGNEIVLELRSTEPLSRINYQVMGRGDILISQSLEVPLSKEHRIRFMVTHSMAPKARVVAFYVRAEDQEFVADAINFDVEGVFRWGRWSWFCEEFRKLDDFGNSRCIKG